MLILITIMVIGLRAEYLVNKVYIGEFTDYSVLEVWWTVVPGVVLRGVALPSLRLLYYADERESVGVSVGVVGHQWYWEYRGVGYCRDVVESYIGGGVRLMDVDTRATMPVGVGIQILVRGRDVIHA